MALFTIMLLLFCLKGGAQNMETDSVAVLDSVKTYTVQEADSALEQGKRKPMGWLVNYLRNANKESECPFDCSFVVGPFYNATTSFALGGGISGLYSWDRDDKNLKKSTLSAIAKVSIRGMVCLEVTGRNYMRRDRQRWNYRLEVSNAPMKFWGIGYNQGLNDENKTSYKRTRIIFHPDYLFRLCRNLYVGPMLNFNWTQARDLDSLELIGKQRTSIVSAGVGGTLLYDSRDFAQNAYSGQYLRVEQVYYPGGINRKAFYSTDITFSTYHGLWRTAVLAIELHSLLTYGSQVPWTMLARVADDSNRMRGYYEGRYCDRGIVEMQVELRQRLPKRFGLVFFAGAANVFPDLPAINLRHTLPNYGTGLRWEFKKRVNIRLDLGMTKNRPGVVFNINEAF